MKSLQTIQKVFRVFQILTKIAMILSFAWAGMAALGMLCGVVWYRGGIVVGANRELLYALTETGGMIEMIGVLFVDVIVALVDGVLLAFAYRYLNAEQADGTPFTHRGADQIKRLGIRTIVLPLVTTILVAVVYAVFNLPQNAGNDWSNGFSVALGIVLIFASLIFRYGAELERARKDTTLPSVDCR